MTGERDTEQQSVRDYGELENSWAAAEVRCNKSEAVTTAAHSESGSELSADYPRVASKPACGGDQMSAVSLPSTGTPSCSWENTGSNAGDEIIGPDGGTYIWVPAGSFQMGREVDQYKTTLGHRVELSGFWLGKYPVTNGQYLAYCQATGRQFPEASQQGEDHPVVWVDWDEATAYCEYYGLTLPTEAQWEYAAAGPESRTYPFGVVWAPDRLCWDGKRGPQNRTFPVGCFSSGASWCAAQDMAGNVWEWCADRVRSQGYALRGGSWKSVVEIPCRCTRHYTNDPGYRNDDCGFRCAKTP